MARTSPATFQRLVEFAESGGNPDNVGSVIGSVVPSVIQLYMDKLRREQWALFAKFTTKPPTPALTQAVDDGDGFSLGDDDGDGFSLGDDDGGGFSLGDENTVVATPVIPDATPGDPLRSLERIAEYVKELPVDLPLGLPKKAAELFPRIRLRGSDGTTTDLTVFSEHEGKFLILTIKERDIRTIRVKGTNLTVDYSELVTNPDGITNGYKNSDLKTVADLS